MKCSNCGAEMMPGAQFCQVCGATQPMQQGFNNAAQQPYQQQMYQGAQPPVMVSSEDAPVWLKIVSFLIPIVGLIMWAVKKKDEPVAAKSCITWGIAGFATSIILGWLC